MNRFVALVRGLQLLTNVPKNSISEIAEILDSTS